MPATDDQLRRLFEAGNEDALHAAAERCLYPGASTATVQRWVIEALLARHVEHMERLSSGMGATARWLQRRKKDLEDLVRYTDVARALKAGHSTFDDEVFRHVSAQLKDTPWWAAPSTIRTAYWDVKKAIKETPERYTFHAPAMFWPEKS